MSDAHHYYLGTYEAEQDQQDQAFKEKAEQVADAAMEAVLEQLDLKGQDWELLHKKISNYVNDVLLEQGE